MTDTKSHETARTIARAVPKVVAGIDIGGTKTSVVLCGQDGTIYGSGVVATSASEGGDKICDATIEFLRQIESDTGITASALGVGAAGVIDQLTGAVTAASRLFHGWAGYPLARQLVKRVDIPVTVDNDVNAFLRGEMSHGAVRGERNVIGIALGTGVGGAIAIGGEVFTGQRGAAGEIGHTPGYSDLMCTCGHIGHLETVSSGRSIEARYAELTGSTGVTAEVIAYRARVGDEHARLVFDTAGKAVALALVTASTLLDLSHAVIGGGVRESWDLLRPVLLRTLADNEPVSGHPLTVVPSSLGSQSVALGAAAQAWQLISV